LRLEDVKKIHRSLLHGAGWLGEVKKIALKIYKIKRLGFKLTRKSREAVKTITEAF
jgi:UDP-glucose 4-epimerase